jgi:hypothetical protein
VAGAGAPGAHLQVPGVRQAHPVLPHATAPPHPRLRPRHVAVARRLPAATLAYATTVSLIYAAAMCLYFLYILVHVRVVGCLCMQWGGGAASGWASAGSPPTRTRSPGGAGARTAPRRRTRTPSTARSTCTGARTVQESLWKCPWPRRRRPPPPQAPPPPPPPRPRRRPTTARPPPCRTTRPTAPRTITRRRR